MNILFLYHHRVRTLWRTCLLVALMCATVAYARAPQTTATVILRTANTTDINHKQGELVFLLHGITRSARDMEPLALALQAQGYDTAIFDYPSTHYELDQLAAALAQGVQLYGKKKKKIHFIAHSMGGIVIRHYLSSKHAAPNANGRIVMIGTPNNGARLADMLDQFEWFKRMLGPAGQQLGAGTKGGCATAGIPKNEIGVIAGGIGSYPGMNPLIREDNDGVVGVSETKIPGYKDFLLVRSPHRLLPKNKHSIAATIRFIQTGKF